MTPEFASLVNPVIHYVLDLTSRIKPGEPVPPAERDQIQRKLRDAQERAHVASASVTAEEFELARRGLIYWIDEMLTATDEKWRDNTLEWTTYRSQLRAGKFYEEGELQVRRSSGNVIELWYLAMVLGFEGDIAGGSQNWHRRDFVPPPGVSGVELAAWKKEARQRWAKELELLIPERRNLGERAAPRLERNVEPRVWEPIFWTTFQGFVILFLICGFLFYLNRH